MEGVEASRLLRLIEHFESQGVETVVAGAASGGADQLRLGESLSMPLVAGDISEGIALAFQLTCSSPTSH